MRKEESFMFIENSIDSTSLEYIRTFQCISQKGDDISSLLRAIRIQAKNLGANCFRLRNFTRYDTTGIMVLTLATYFASDSILKINAKSHEKNTVYIFSDDKFNKKVYSFQFNDQDVTIKSGTFFKYQIKEGEEITINKGGLNGTTVQIKWEKEKSCVFFTLKGFAFTDTNSPFYLGYNGARVSYTTGRIIAMSTNLGLLLAATLKEYK